MLFFGHINSRYLVSGKLHVLVTLSAASAAVSHTLVLAVSMAKRAVQQLEHQY